MMKLTLQKGYIENAEADIIVNAADSYLWFGDGVDGALRQRGGWDYIHDCIKIAQTKTPIPVGHCVAMKNRSKHLKCKHIVHAVSYALRNDKPYENYEQVLINLIKLAKRLRAKSIAMPILGSGAFRLDAKRCYRIIKKFINNQPGELEVLIVHPNFKP